MSKRAFLCGVNRYQIAGVDLRGCVNDVANMRQVLIDLYDFDADDIVVVTDTDATKARIEAGLTDLIAGAVAGDVLYFHFSGHGSNVPDQDGDEADGRDEVFCPTDLDWRDPLRDDWLRTELDKLPDGVNLTFVSDCCHSGTVTRQLTPPDAPRKQRYLVCPRDLFAAESGRSLSGGIRSLRRSRGGVVPGVAGGSEASDVSETDLTEVLLTWCRDDQTSADAFIDDDFHGALTHSLAACLRDADGDVTYRELHAMITERLAADEFDQVPQLEGRAANLDRPFLAPFA